METHPKSTTCILRMLMHLSSGTWLLPGEFQPPKLAGALSLYVCAGFGASQKTEPYRTKISVFPQNWPKTDRPRPVWNHNNTILKYNM